jgi:hypothetical protein
VIGIDNDNGNAVRGARGFEFAVVVDDLAADDEAVDSDDEGDDVVDVDFGAVVVVAFGAVVVVVESFGTVGVVDDGMTLDVAAPAGPRPANTLAAARTRPPVNTANEERGFRLKVLLLLCMGYTDPLLSPRRWGLYPRE